MYSDGVITSDSNFVNTFSILDKRNKFIYLQYFFELGKNNFKLDNIFLPDHINNVNTQLPSTYDDKVKKKTNMRLMKHLYHQLYNSYRTRQIK